MLQHAYKQIFFPVNTVRPHISENYSRQNRYSSENRILFIVIMNLQI